MERDTKLFVTSGTITDIANAIREKEGSTEPIPGDQLASRIAALPESDEITHSKIVEYVAQDQIKIGDTVYTVDSGVKDLEAEFHIANLSNIVYTASFSPDGKTLILGGDFSGCGKVYSVDGTNITYVSDIYADNGTTALTGHVYTTAFSPDGKTLVLGGGKFAGYAKVYDVNGTNITYVSDIYADNGTTAFDDYVKTVAFSPDGTTLVLGGEFSRYAKVYSVNGQTITYVSDIYANNGTSALLGNVYTASFSPDGKTLVLGGEFINRANVYSVNGTNITYVSNIYADAGTTALGVYHVHSSAFSPDGKTLVLGGGFSGKAKVYSVNGQTITYVSNIYANNGTTALSRDVETVAFSPDGTTLVLDSSKVYSVNGQTITYVSDIYADAGTTALSKRINTAIFSPDGKSLVLGGYFSGYAKVYSVNRTNITYVIDIYASNGTSALSYDVNTAAFSPDGKILVLGGKFSGYAKMYAVNGTNITYIRDIYADNGTTALDDYVRTVTFSPDSKTLVLGGQFSGKAKVYSISGQTITYISDIYADSDITALSSGVYTATFSPDGKTLVLGGNFSGCGKVYSVNSQTITYVSDIYADNNSTILDYYVWTATFSPDGKTLVLGGYFIGKAKVYSVNGQTITYISDIYANNGTTALSDEVHTVAFSPDSKTLVLGGYFSGRAKVYSVSGQTITYVSDIYADSSTTALSSYVKAASFSPDGKTLVLGGNFTGKAKVYSVNGQTITYVSDIYADAGTISLSNAVYTATFSPNGKTLVLSGIFSGYSKSYCISGTEIAYISPAYLAENGEFTNLVYGCNLGFAKSNANVGEKVTVRTIGKFLQNPPIINFTIRGYGDYQAEEGMTWGEWCDSEYSVDGIIIHDNNYIVCMDGPRDYFYVTYSNTLPVETTDVIIDKMIYTYV